MLFAAGMGIGLMFFAVAEPIQHYSAPPEAAPMSIEAAREAMVITFFHWGVHAWGVYAVVGLSLAYFSFRYNLPLTIRSGPRPCWWLPGAGGFKGGGAAGERKGRATRTT